ncbi:hypothetical protein FOZ61_000066 [Perkinsus olseni]|uniref:Uncharacterized protein n=1 Tax=Perkinsus olseni TaxID=32597 RepID=A0A7J6MU53_PEROL|nr:hypothetical protein FOZ61_000066 [Perkinsus olseni]KAF4675119.1 hypothetical protein FOL46_002706 [Perkinsus olseni]
MVFGKLFGLQGQQYSYRGFYTLLCASYIGESLFFNIVALVILWLMGRYLVYPEFPKKGKSKKTEWLWIAGIVVVNFLLALLIIGLFCIFGAFTFGDYAGWIYFVCMPILYLCFLVSVFFLRRSICYDWAFGFLIYTAAFQAWFLIQIPTMFNYVYQYLTWLIGIAASLPIMGAVWHSFASYWPTRTLIKKWWFWLAEVCTLAFGIFITYCVAGTCIAPYNPMEKGWWIQLEQSLFWSSRMFRTFTSSPRFCPPDQLEPCHVYLTPAQNMTDSMFVNVHMGSNTQSLKVHYNMKGGPEIGVIDADEFEVPLLDWRDQRNVYAAYLPDLTPGGVVEFTLESDRKHFDEVYRFRTANLTGTVHFTDGGDAGTSTYVQEVNSHVGKYDPLFAVDAGDVAYDNGLFTCACVWDSFLSNYETIKTTQGYLVPLIVTLGNHDVGANHHNKGAIAAFMDPEQCDDHSLYGARPPILAYFPFEAVDGHAKPVCQRSPNHVHYAGKALTYWALDSLYATDDPMVAANFVSERMGNYSDVVNHVAGYHVPMYPNDGGTVDTPLTQPMRDYWPQMIFDKYHFKVCFGHHAHVLKRTMPMTNNSVAEGGVLYVDSLVFGPPFVTSGIDYHVWHATAEDDGHFKVIAVDRFGKVVDSTDNYETGQWPM